jgi:D-sedoheptulose 7-phosphate isomerase
MQSFEPFRVVEAVVKQDAWIVNYVAQQKAAIDRLPLAEVERIIRLLRDANAAGRRIFVCGNGGNAANAAHFATDLGKGSSLAMPRPFKVLSMADNVAWMTAIGNDYSFEEVFVRQLENHAEPGDVLLCSSVSGSSPNLVAAARWAKEHGLVTVSLVGGKRGAVAAHSDHLLVVEDTHYGRVEDAQMMMLHMFCYAFMEKAED